MLVEIGLAYGKKDEALKKYKNELVFAISKQIKRLISEHFWLSIIKEINEDYFVCKDWYQVVSILLEDPILIQKSP